MRDETKKARPSSAQDLTDAQWDLECNLIGCLLFDKGFYATVAGRLRPEYFQFIPHRKVVEEFIRRTNVGLPADGLSILQSFENDIVSDNGLLLHEHLKDRSKGFSTKMGEGQVESLRLSYTLLVAEHTSKHLRTPGGPDEALQDFFAAVDDVRFDYQQAQGAVDTMSIGASADAFAAKLSDRIDGKVIDRRVYSGLAPLDNMVGGFGDGHLIIIAGRPGMGKSTLATSIARGAALQAQHDLQGFELKPQFPTLFFSFEMSRDEIMARMMAEDIAHAAGELGPQLQYRALLNPKVHRGLWDVRLPGFDQSYRNYVFDAQRRMRSLPIELDCSTSKSIGELAASARKVKTDYAKVGLRLSMIVIDYLKYIKASDRYKGNRVLEVGEITGSLKKLAKELELPIILLCQLSRAVENRKDKTPMLSDLRESGDIEQDADVVMFCFRKSYYDRTDSASHTFDVLVEKNRHGPTGKVELWADLGRSFITGGTASKS